MAKSTTQTATPTVNTRTTLEAHNEIGFWKMCALAWQSLGLFFSSTARVFNAADAAMETVEATAVKYRNETVLNMDEES